MFNAGFNGKVRIYLLLLVYILIAYFPLSSFLFALKNDAITDNFPPKYFFSAALHAGEIPLWNPFINFGLPAYADLGFAYWQPITWLFGFIGYNLYTLTIEILLYIWLATIFMYDLGRYLGHNKTTCFIIAIMFGSSGFFTGNLQFINFITCAAFIPLCLRYYLEWQNHFTLNNTIKCALALYLLVTGGHPAIPIAMFFFLVVINIAQLSFTSGKLTLATCRSLFSRNFILLLTAAIIALPLLYSTYEILPWITRNASVQQANYTDTGFTFPSYISFLYPFSTGSNNLFWGNSILMRNGYFSLLGIALLATILWQKKTTLQKALLVTGLFFLVISAGGILKSSLYSHLPLLQYIRTNGEFRVFTILAFILLAAYPLNHIMESSNKKAFKNLLQGCAWIALATIILALIAGYFQTFQLPDQFGKFTFPAKARWLLDNISFYHKLLLNAIVVLLLAVTTILLLRKFTLQKVIIFFVLADTIMVTWLTLPQFGIQSKSVQELQNLLPAALNKSIYQPGLRPIENNTKPELNKIIGCWSYYTMQPGTPEYCDYPTIFTSTELYFNSPDTAQLKSRPFVFLDSGDQLVTIEKFHNNSMVFSFTTSIPCQLVLLQNNYPKWQAYENGKALEILSYKKNFMAVELLPGRHKVEFHFANRKLSWVIIIWIISILISVLLLFKKNLLRSSSPS